MENTDYLKDIAEIKTIMNRSTRFLSLSGLSGILAGVYALIGGWIAHGILFKYRSAATYHSQASNELILILIGIAMTIALASILTAYYLSKQIAIKNNENLWTPASRKLLSSFAIPMVTGGFFILILTFRSYHELIVPSSLVFYGLSLINASKHTLSTVKYFGQLEIILGLLALLYIGNELLFWFIGFGILHIIYGTLIYFRTEK